MLIEYSKLGVSKWYALFVVFSLHSLFCFVVLVRRWKCVTTKERCSSFISDLDLPVRRFCKNVDISSTTYYRWQSDDLRLSQETENRIKNYLQRFGYWEMRNRMEQIEGFISTTECNKKTGILTRKIRELCNDGKIEFYKDKSGKLWINEKSLDLFLKNNSSIVIFVTAILSLSISSDT